MLTTISDRLHIEETIESGSKLLVVSLLKPEKEVLYSYQIDMIANNPGRSILPFQVHGKNNEIALCYHLSSLVTLKDFINNKKVTKNDFLQLLIRISRTILENKSILLHETGYILDDRYIYVNPDNGDIHLAYVPVKLDLQFNLVLRDFIIRLITCAVSLELTASDNYLQQVLEFTQRPEFNLKDFLMFLFAMEGKHACADNEKPVHTESDVMQEGSKNRKEEKGGYDEIKNLIKPVKQICVYDIQMLVILVLTQVTMIGLAMMLERFTKTLLPEAGTRYLVTALFVLAADLLIYKYVFKLWWANRNSQNSGETQTNAASGEAPEIEKTQGNSLLGTKQGSNPKCAKIAQLSADQAEKALSGPSLETAGSIKVCEPADRTMLLSDEDKFYARLILEQDGGSTYEIDNDLFIIGRNADVSNMVIQNKAIGRIHAEIIKTKDGCYIIDRNSKNGTYVNGVRLLEGQQYLLKTDDIIRFANTDYRFETNMPSPG